MSQKIEQVLALTKEIHTAEAKLEKLRFELAQIVEPVRSSVPSKAKNRKLASKVLRSVGTPLKPASKQKKLSKRAAPTSMEALKERVLMALEKGPQNANSVAKIINGSKTRIYYVFGHLKKEGLIRPVQSEVVTPDGRRISVQKWIPVS